MTYGQLLRKLASLSEYQLKQKINVVTVSNMTGHGVERVCIWDDGIEDSDTADVEIQVSIDG